MMPGSKGCGLDKYRQIRTSAIECDRADMACFGSVSALTNWDQRWQAALSRLQGFSFEGAKWESVLQDAKEWKEEAEGEFTLAPATLLGFVLVSAPNGAPSPSPLTSHPHPHLSPLTSHLSPSHPLTHSHLSPFTGRGSPTSGQGGGSISSTAVDVAARETSLGPAGSEKKEARKKNREKKRSEKKEESRKRIENKESRKTDA